MGMMSSLNRVMLPITCTSSHPVRLPSFSNQMIVGQSMSPVFKKEAYLAGLPRLGAALIHPGQYVSSDPNY